jgi:hypothetical protein
LLVFLHVSSKQRALQSALSDALPGVTVTAVGRIGDFDRALKDGTDAVLALPVVLNAKGLIVQVQGVRGGATDETYSLVGADSAPSPGAVKSVGAVDILGRDGTNSFVQGLLGSQPKVERVTKIEDLLPLLQVQTVEAILCPTRLVGELKSVTKLTLAQTDLAKRVGLPALASFGGPGADVASAVKQSTAAAKAVGVESWK